MKHAIRICYLMFLALSIWGLESAGVSKVTFWVGNVLDTVKLVHIFVGRFGLYS